jgi:hypothetical protein
MGSGGFGSGWFGSGWLGSGWFDAMGSGWTGGGGGGGVPVYAMRPDRPLADVMLASHNLNAKFPEHAWDSDLVALTIMPEFLDQKVNGQHWKDAVIAALPGPTSPITQAMIQDMVMKAVTERPEALGEIVQEHNNFQARYLHLLSISNNSHPHTFLLMKLAARVGEFSMISLKRLKAPWDLRSRPRPSQVCPTLFPAVPVPGHSTYPAGHALIAWLTTESLKDITKLQANAYAKSLDALAERVGNNRVFAGLHFQEDIDHGKIAGVLVHKFLWQCPLYQDTLGKAQQEWA